MALPTLLPPSVPVPSSLMTSPSFCPLHFSFLPKTPSSRNSSPIHQDGEGMAGCKCLLSSLFCKG